MAATVSVVHFNSKVLQSNNNQNSGNNNGASQDSGGGGRREVIILRKASHPPHILPATAAIADGKSLSERKDAGEILISSHGSSRKKQGKDLRTAPQPVAVARRNARERNRVKQVNNGFANLRQHIPSFIAQAFESNTRGGSKKLSKVETLRMAVEYIRSLEDLLAEDNSSSPTSHQSLPSISMLSDDDDSESLGGTTPHHHHHHQHPLQQYTYQLSHLVYSDDNSENLEPIDSLMMQDGLMEFRGVQDLALLHQGLTNNDSLSPGMYSEQSLSPPLSQHPSDGLVVLRTGMEGEGEVWREIKQEQVELPVISLKSEQELQHQHQKTEIIDVMQWWEAQSPPSSS